MSRQWLTHLVVSAEFTVLLLHTCSGLYEAKGYFFSYHIPSYTPISVVLICGRQQVSSDASTPSFIAISQVLYSIAAEFDTVAQRVAPFLSFALLSDNVPTVQGAFDVFSRERWLYLVCHKMPTENNNFESSFVLQDGQLMIGHTIRLQIPEFAFLSACHTTLGVKVMGSMWSADDNVAGGIVSVPHKNLVDNSGSRRAAGALRRP
jgi:hypothetical protein